MILLINGCRGRMGSALTRLARQRGHVCHGADVDIPLSDLPQGDVIVDFSCAQALEGVLEAAEARGIPAVIAATGHTDRQLAALEAAAQRIPLFVSGNLSLGVAQLCRMARETARLFPQARIEILETHHVHKKDAPSGTAKMLFEAVKEARPGLQMAFGQPAGADQAGVHSLRMGEVIGIHEVHIAAPTQTLVLRHEAHDRSLFAEGALEAAAFVLGRAPGLYAMADLLKG